MISLILKFNNVSLRRRTLRRSLLRREPLVRHGRGRGRQEAQRGHVVAADDLGHQPQLRDHGKDVRVERSGPEHIKEDAVVKT